MALVVVVIVSGIIYFLQLLIYRMMWDKGYEVKLGFEEYDISEGQDTIVSQEFLNNKWIPLPLVEICFGISRNARSYSQQEYMEDGQEQQERVKTDVISIKPYSRIRRRIKLPKLKRGYYRIRAFSTTVHNLFLTEAFSQNNMVDDVIYVYPAFIDSQRMNITFNRLLMEFTTKQLTFEDPFLIKGIRDYEIYDPQRIINWKASAKAGELMVNQFDNAANQAIKIIINFDSLNESDDCDIFEESIRIAGTLADRCLEMGIPTGLLSNASDCVNYGFIRLEPMGGKNQREEILQALSRLMIVRRPQDMCSILSEELDNAYKGKTIYVMISVFASDKVQQLYNDICNDAAGSMWIMPSDSKHWNELTCCNKADFIRWEVPENAGEH